MTDLHPGDVLSYSAGSTQTGPHGFRKLKPAAGSPLAAANARWPDIPETLADRTVLYINAYPATIGVFTPGITVDTYLSPRILSRALQLGKLGGHPVILVAQPLFVADALMRHIAAERPLPDTMLLGVGGYVLPRSLEQTLRSLLAPHVDRLLIVQYFGAAEVDAGCMMARERNDKAELIYYPRPDVVVEIDPEGDGDELLLGLRSADGTVVAEPFRTGDRTRREGDGWVIWNHRRLHPRVHEALESWTETDWNRRTGYVRRDDETIWIQLREGVAPDAPAELEFFDFARRFGFSWLDKPYWR